jgi:Zn-dependent peptidase ImmA (M78 family)/plasmid maintenance system antidote protein VapI
MSETFQPDWMSAPGATIGALLQQKKISIQQFAKLMECSQETAKGLLTGRAVITGEIAQSLSKKLGGSPDFWASREEQFRQDVARLQSKGRNAASRLWLNELPISDMLRLGWIKSGQSVEDRVKACLKFFDVPNVDIWRSRYSQVLAVVSFRKSLTYRSEPGAILTWLRRGELLSEKIRCKKWNLIEFKNQLENIRKLTHIKEVQRFLPQLQKICADCGVALVIARAPKGCRASGATRFLSPSKAMILLSFRYLTDDHFWFTFFHEAAHLILHNENAIFIEDGSEATEDEEAEANNFAANFLIPDSYRVKLKQKKVGLKDILRTAAKFGISRGIVVGQLQHLQMLDTEKFNWMKRRYNWTEIERAVSL